MNKILIIMSITAFMLSLPLFSSEALACGDYCCDVNGEFCFFCPPTDVCGGNADCYYSSSCVAPDPCAGVTCPPNSQGSCDYYDECDTSGSYLITYWTCNSATGNCEPGSTYGTCSRNTDGTSCGAGQVCSGGSCVSTCTDECPSGTTQCSGTGYQTCGNYDADSCLEWSSVTSCGTNSCPADFCSGLLYYNFPPSCTNTCSGGSCQSCLCSASQTTCNLGDPCKNYYCSGATGCGETNKADGTACTVSGQSGTCQSGSCVVSALGVPTPISVCSNNQIIYDDEMPTQVTLTWSSVAGATYYEYAYAYADPPGSFITGTTAFNSAQAFFSVGAWFWKVRACNLAGCGDWSSLDWSSIGECGVARLSGSVDAVPEYVNLGDTVSVTVTGTTDSPRYMTALGMSDSTVPYGWRYCCCLSDFYGPGTGCGYETYSGSGIWELCSSPGTNSCSKTWLDTADSSLTYYGVVYDYGPTGDVERAQGNVAWCPDKSCPLWDDINLKECNIDADCVAQNNRAGICRSPSGTGGLPYDYTCRWPACAYNSDCTTGYCCVASTAEGSPPSGPDTGTCVPEGIYSANSRYLCDPPEWEGRQEKEKTLIEKIINFLNKLLLP